MPVFKNVKRPTLTRCLWCDGPIENGHDLLTIYLSKLCLCGHCQRQLALKKRRFVVEKVKAESFYQYDAFFSSLLIQYKECFDEALHEVFLKDLNHYLAFRYHGYHLVCMPSSQSKLAQRGFDHLHLMFQDCHLPFCDCLYKIDDTQQKMLSANKRQALRLGLKEVAIPTKLLLVDDVCSTKATLKQAIKLLDNGQRRLRIVVVAYNP
ncbi:MAG: hypothetical protein MR210_01835 [Erysipelotrichaceae bacterium]|nr:hypothetical protein [Erysipelotrichaceae bacterium]MDY5252882.1 hypothetical protein [Erysipelotrichaceae bacterium]